MKIIEWLFGNKKEKSYYDSYFCKTCGRRFGSPSGLGGHHSGKKCRGK